MSFAGSESISITKSLLKRRFSCEAFHGFACTGLISISRLFGLRQSLLLSIILRCSFTSSFIKQKENNMSFEPKQKVELDPPKDDLISHDYLSKCDGQ